jgi:hypothetical protein
MFLFLGLTVLCVGGFAFETTPNLDGIPAPKRIKQEKSLDGFVSLNCARSVIYFNDFRTENINKEYDVFFVLGDYKKAIEKARGELEKYQPGREYVEGNLNQDDAGHAWRAHLNMLALAFELNGDWREALDAYAVLYAADSEEAWRAKARIMYATGNRDLAFRYAAYAIARRSYVSLDSVRKKVATYRDELTAQKRTWERSTKVFSLETGALDEEWRAVWELYDNCARVVCPELPYAVSESENSTTIKRFNALQTEAFKNFIIFMEQEYARVDLDDQKQFQPQMEFLHKLVEFF